MQAMKKIIPTVEQLRKDVSAIYIDENMDYEYLHERMTFHLNPDYPDNPKDLTYDECIGKYKTHIDLWNEKNREREKKGFLGKLEAQKRKTFLEFLDARLYKIDWDSLSSSPIRDKYLFGDFPTDYLKKKLDEFKRKFPNETDNSKGKKEGKPQTGF
jgi:hypothetical protein